MEDSDLNNLLVKKLNFYLWSEVHTVVDLSSRDLTGEKGSLCGLAALYRAGLDSLLTVSHLKQLSYQNIRTLLTAEMNNPAAAAMNDYEFLVEFHKSKFNYFSSLL